MGMCGRKLVYCEDWETDQEICKANGCWYEPRIKFG